jgi:hypothetical protein
MTMYQYKVSGHLASAIVNGDYSGLDDAECKQLDAFLASLPNHYHYKTKQIKCFEPINYEAEGNFARCEVTGLFSECLDFQLTYI